MGTTTVMSTPLADIDFVCAATDIATAFGVTPTTVLRWADSGKITCILVGGKWRFPTPEWLKQQGLRDATERRVAAARQRDRDALGSRIAPKYDANAVGAALARFS